MLSDDTVELELTPDELSGLSRAMSSSVAPSLPQIGKQDPVAIPFHDRPRTSVRGMAWNVAAVIAFAMFDWWGVDHVFGQEPESPAMAATLPGPEKVQPELPGTPQQAVVRVRNPFDASEFFDFPAGTSAADNRAKVAELLLQRARERRSQAVRVKPAGKLHAAKYAANARGPMN
jgi:hypothetical protein